MADNRPHIIKKQILELQGLREKDAPDMQQQLSSLFKNRLLPIIDRHLSALSPDGTTLRIEKLELDLGRIDAQDFEAELIKQLDLQLQRQLSQLTPTLEETEKVPSPPKKEIPVDHQKELFSYFVQTGNLPWWAASQTSNPVLESLDYLMEKNPEWLKKALREWLPKEYYLRRLVRQLPVGHLLKLAGLQIRLTNGNFEEQASTFFRLLNQLASSIAVVPSRLQEEASLKLLQIAFMHNNVITKPVPFWEEWLLQLAVTFRIKYERLLEVLQVTFSEKNEQASTGTGLATMATIIRQLAKEHQDKNSSLLPKQTILNSDNLDRDSNNLDRNSDNLDPSEAQKEFPQKVDLHLKEDHKATPTEKLVKNTFSDTNELFIENAGLVILWPYLPRFFQSLNLVEGKQLVDIASAHRAAGLLQYLADGQVDPPEYLLGFNKILCGLKWDEVLDFGEPITEAEATECDVLLQAVIANAPVLKNMTPDGFRGSFLLRKGMLRAVSNNWELHVEKETYDVVLDRFPWSWKMVKLPWLKQLIIVEW